MKIVFAGDSVIKILSEVIDVTLDDQGSAWDTKTCLITRKYDAKLLNANQKNFQKN